jgi:hypothetical protein
MPESPGPGLDGTRRCGSQGLHNAPSTEIPLDEKIIFGQSKRQDLTNEAIRIAHDLCRWKPPDISTGEMGELSPG